jgi:hypothetical protein
LNANYLRRADAEVFRTAGAGGRNETASA